MKGLLREREAPDRVLDHVLPEVRIEGGVREPAPGERVALVASFGRSNVTSRSLRALVTELEGCGYPVIVVRASDDDAPLDWGHDFPSSPLVIRKPNIGYDFGSWSTGMALFPEVLQRRYVLLANDSLVGPFEGLAPLIDDAEGSSADIWAATHTTQFFPHLQSFFMRFRDGALADEAMRAFWLGLRVETEKLRIVEQYELGLNRMIFAEGFSSTAAFPSELVVEYGQNPSINGWRRLLDLGFPFVKRELLLNPSLVRDGHAVLPELVRRFGVDAASWV